MAGVKRLTDSPAGGQGEAEGAAEAPAQVHGRAEAGAAGRPPMDAVGRRAHGHQRGGKLWDTGLPDKAFRGAVMRTPGTISASVLYAGDVGLIPGSGRPLGEVMATLSSILARSGRAHV